jgi:hypothetical protein
VWLTAGQSYLVLFHTDSEVFPMVDPSIFLRDMMEEPGQFCGTALDVSAAAMPVVLDGTFELDPAAASSCDTTPANAVWYEYTPSSTAAHDFFVWDQTAAYAWLTVALFDGSSCSPLGTELACYGDEMGSVSTIATVTQGQPYRVLFHTDEEAEPMADPYLWISTEPDPGRSCGAAVELTTSPHALSGVFNFPGGAWARYTAPTTGSFTIRGQNGWFESWGVAITVYEDTGCSPLGAVLAGETGDADSATVTVSLTQGASYLIAFESTTSVSTFWPMLEPVFTITGP